MSVFSDLKETAVATQNARVMKERYEKWVEESKIVPVGFKQIGETTDRASSHFAKTESGYYATMKTEQSQVSDNTFVTVEGFLPVTIGGKTQDCFLQEYTYSTNEPDYVSGFAYFPESGKCVSYLGEAEKGTAFDVSSAFEALKTQAFTDAPVVDMDSEQ